MKNIALRPDLEKLKNSKQLLIIFILLLVCVVFWAIITVFNSQKQSVISPELKNSALPLTPVIDEEVLNNLENEQTFSDADLATFVIYRMVKIDGDNRILLPLGTEPPKKESTTTSAPSASPSPAPSPKPTATPTPTPSTSPTPKPTPASTNGAQP